MSIHLVFIWSFLKAERERKQPTKKKKKKHRSKVLDTNWYVISREVGQGNRGSQWSVSW